MQLAGPITARLDRWAARVRVWGFLCSQGWRPWREFVDPNDPGAVGPGCE